MNETYLVIYLSFVKYEWISQNLVVTAIFGMICYLDYIDCVVTINAVADGIVDSEQILHLGTRVRVIERILTSRT